MLALNVGSSSIKSASYPMTGAPTRRPHCRQVVSVGTVECQ